MQNVYSDSFYSTLPNAITISLLALGYRVVGQIKRDIKGRLRTLRAEDTFTHHILQTLVEEYKFFVLVVNNQFDEVSGLSIAPIRIHLNVLRNSLHL